MANEQVFNNRVGNYQQGRPGYSSDAVALIVNQMLKQGNKIADVGSGTGLLAKEFMTKGYDVYCVEPNDEMRSQAESLYSTDPHFISVNGTAENTTLKSNSVDLVTAAAAFHWFDAEAFRKECKRILKPNGYVALVFNVRDYNDDFTKRQHEICLKLCPGFMSLKHNIERTLPKIEGFFKGEIQTAEFVLPLKYTKDKFIQRSMSSSYAPSPADPNYLIYEKELRDLMEEFAPDSDEIIIPNATIMYWGKV